MNSELSTLLDTGLIQDPGAIPLVIGVAGHRDPRPQDLPVLRQRCREVLNDIVDKLPHTPLLMINGLAAGMDCEAAEIFYDLVNDQKNKNASCPRHMLVGALPKPRDIYLREDFPDKGDNANTFDRNRTIKLLDQCDAVLDPDNCDELKTGKHNQGTRSHTLQVSCYGRQGLFLVRNCYLLIAFSNGVDSEKIGGTSHTVLLQRGQFSPLFLEVEEVMADREPGVAVEISTPRISDKVNHCHVGSIHYWGENTKNNEKKDENSTNIEQESLDKLLDYPEYPARLNTINSQLNQYPPHDSYGEGLQSSLWRYADSKANEQKNKYIRWCRSLMSISVLLALGLSQREWQSFGLLVVLLAVVIFPRLQEGPKLRFIQWRCLAESLKVTDHWSALQIQADAADKFHSQTNRTFSWIRTILRSRRLQLLSLQTDSSFQSSFVMSIDKSQTWIRGQIKWLNNTIEKQHQWDRILLSTSALSFIFTLISSIGHQIGLININEMWTESGMAITAAFLGYRELLGYSDTNSRYARSKSHFERALNALSSLKIDPEDPILINYRKGLVIEAIGSEKIDELNDWVGDQLQKAYSPGG